ncbi:hypothetical protein BDV98DRAFT_295337 [Pterulicium gracile]|uniref:Uncharacterized protein n=1 Tax=Pterulicium gracile TaxID=1884261 RepID=A0A5C3QTN8_9AGAR|nr:hypothetical protein BDV98DRAFT_295337 [Pterula gracilis]
MMSRSETNAAQSGCATARTHLRSAFTEVKTLEYLLSSLKATTPGPQKSATQPNLPATLKHALAILSSAVATIEQWCSVDDYTAQHALDAPSYAKIVSTAYMSIFVLLSRLGVASLVTQTPGEKTPPQNPANVHQLQLEKLLGTAFSELEQCQLIQEAQSWPHVKRMHILVLKLASQVEKLAFQLRGLDQQSESIQVHDEAPELRHPSPLVTSMASFGESVSSMGSMTTASTCATLASDPESLLASDPESLFDPAYKYKSKSPATPNQSFEIYTKISTLGSPVVFDSPSPRFSLSKSQISPARHTISRLDYSRETCTPSPQISSLSQVSSISSHRCSYIRAGAPSPTPHSYKSYTNTQVSTLNASPTAQTLSPKQKLPRANRDAQPGVRLFMAALKSSGMNLLGRHGHDDQENIPLVTQESKAPSLLSRLSHPSERASALLFRLSSPPAEERSLLSRECWQAVV